MDIIYQKHLLLKIFVGPFANKLDGLHLGIQALMCIDRRKEAYARY